MKKKLLLGAVALMVLSLSTAWASEQDNLDTDKEALSSCNVDTCPRVVKSFPPAYPMEAKMNFYEGRVVLQFIVTEDGAVKNIEIIDSKPSGVFDKCSIEAVSKYQFTPGIKNGVPVSTIVKLPIVFEPSSD